MKNKARMYSSKFSIALIVFLSIVSGFSAVAQSMSYQDYVNGTLDKYIVKNAQIGSLICEDLDGTLILCSGAVEETVLGVTTSAPMVSINKPVSPDASKYIFEAIVSVDNGVIHKGDFLKSGKNGTLVKAESADMVYAIALGAFDGAEGKILVKLASR